jgi:hypothetical protein
MRKWIYPLVLVSGVASAQTYTQIDYSRKPPDGWPTLRQEIVYGSEEQMKRWCARLPEADSGRVIGCAKAYFEWDLCMIFLSTKDPEHLKHEQAHCMGYNHVGQPDLAKSAFEGWKKK